MKKTYNTLCFGEILWDIFHDQDQQWQVLGGAPSNLCYFLNMLGEPALLISQVGKDTLGQKALDQLVSLQIPHLVTQSTTATGQVDISFDRHEPQYQFNTPAAWDTIPYSQSLSDISESIKMIAFGSLAQRHLHADGSFSTLQKILQHYPKATRFLDLNLRAPHYEETRIVELLQLADILKINESEFNYLKQLFSLDTLSTRDALYQLILQLKLTFVILTLGAKGSIVMSETNFSAQHAIKGPIVDTVGAGDAFSAAFLTALNQGANFNTAHQFANQLSYYICTQKGAFVPIPAHYRTELMQFTAW